MVDVDAAEAVFGALDEPAVEEIGTADMGVVAEEDVMAVVAGDGALVGFAEVQPVLIDVVIVLGASHHLIEVFAVLDILTIKTLMRVLAVAQVVPGTILNIVTMEFFERVTFLHHFPSRLVQLILAVGTEINGFYLGLILLFAQLHILEAEFFLAEPHAQEAVLAADTVTEK